jgi:hypothetical protein
MDKGKRLTIAAVGFALAALLSSWNPVAAPFGLLVGLSASVLSLRSLFLGGHRRMATAALALAVLAVAGSSLELALTAGIGRDVAGEPAVLGPSREEAQKQLDQSAETTRAARERAREELMKVGEGAPAGRPDP